MITKIKLLPKLKKRERNAEERKQKRNSDGFFKINILIKS